MKDFEFNDDDNFHLTEQGCMYAALNDFGINVSTVMAKAIADRFMELMVLHGHAKKAEDE